MNPWPSSWWARVLLALWIAPVALVGAACWLWSWARDRAGYGVAWQGEGRRMRLVARLVLEHGLGRELGRGEHATQSCGNRACCNPRHIRLIGEREKIQAATSARRSLSDDQVTEVRRQLAELGAVALVARATGVKYGVVYGVAHGNFSGVPVAARKRLAAGGRP